MITYDEALRIIAEIDKIEEKEAVDLVCCNGRVLASDLYAPIASPPFTNSAMDGYAIKHDDISQRLAISGTLFAKATRPEAVPEYSSGTCVEIMTGAPVPEWADTIVPVENAKKLGSSIEVTTPVNKGSHIRRYGEDIYPETLLMKAGTKLGPEKIMVAAAFGFTALPVYKRPHVTLLSTGDELRQPGEVLEPGTIFNSSRYFLEAASFQVGLSLNTVRTISDNPQSADEKVSEISELEGPTLLLTTGAVSAGERDFIPTLARRLGFETLFHKVAIRPGKPIFLARRNHMLWLGLPGNAVSTCVGWHFFARPLLASWAYVPTPTRRIVTLKNSVKKPEHLRCFFRGEYNGRDVWVANRQGSAQLAASINAECYVELEENQAFVREGSQVPAIIL